MFITNVTLLWFSVTLLLYVVITEQHSVHYKYIKSHVPMCLDWHILKIYPFFSFFFPQSQLYMHLTNYSVNKHNENFERDETVDKGSKRSISWFTEFLRSNDYDVAKFWGDISVRQCFTEPHIHSSSSIYLVFALPFLRFTVFI